MGLKEPIRKIKIADGSVRYRLVVTSIPGTQP